MACLKLQPHSRRSSWQPGTVLQVKTLEGNVEIKVQVTRKEIAEIKAEINELGNEKPNIGKAPQAVKFISF